MNEKTFIIWSIEHGAWWRPNRAGYTTSRNHAGYYGFEEASQILKAANIGNNDVPNEVMIEIDPEKRLDDQ